MMMSKVLRDFPFNLNESPKSADDWYIGILKNTKKAYQYVDFFFIFFELVLICPVPQIDIGSRF